MNAFGPRGDSGAEVLLAYRECLNQSMLSWMGQCRLDIHILCVSRTIGRAEVCI